MSNLQENQEIKKNLQEKKNENEIQENNKKEENIQNNQEKKTEKKKSWSEIEEEYEKEKFQKTQNELEKLKLPLKNQKDIDEPNPFIEKKISGLQSGKIIIEQSDPNSPLYSVKTFEELNISKELLDGIYSMGFTKPSKIQESALPIILGKNPKNLIGQAQSGTGKTATFTLCMLSRSDPTIPYPQAVCVCPTRELSRQIVDVIKEMGKFTKLQTQLVVKDEILPKKINSQIIVGTPGKILDLIQNRSLDLRNVKVFVLDEADFMVDQQGLGDQSIKIKKYLPKNCQILLFSATFKPHVRNYAEKIVGRDRVDIKLKRRQLTLEGIQQLFIDCKSEANKFQVLSDIYGYLTVGQSVVFVTTRATSVELYKKMTQEGHTVSLLHGGDMSSLERDRVIDDFREGKTKVLITTNVLARGIDIQQVMLVINYDLPLDVENRPDTETYLHRIGRSGRFGRKGVAINLVHDSVSRRNLKEIEKFFGRPIRELDPNKLDEIEAVLKKIKEEEIELQMKIDKGEINPDEDDDDDENVDEQKIAKNNQEK